MQGRTPNATFSFHPAHPLYDSHHQQIRSKFRVPVLIRGPPKPPPPKPTHATDEWRRAARAFTQYMLLVFRPWLEEGGTAAGLRISAEQRIVNQLHRNRKATKWANPDDHSGNMMPSRNPTEQPEKDTRIENEAQHLIDMARVEAALDEPESLANFKQRQYNETQSSTGCIHDQRGTTGERSDHQERSQGAARRRDGLRLIQRGRRHQPSRTGAATAASRRPYPTGRTTQ
ncbi:hypothetical protein GHT06_005688 [Daphnia sinensis]|uniref:Uncharacterized protein n=1 Tax=Daphnia sinensis TaxID=1820382 RepID=A0AAD5PQ11_9CRUS|nr:hypothetical protein GHT06_005688 [Daphnia sinensis]